MFDAKRLIGREFRDHNVQQDMKHWPFKVVDVGDKPKIMVEFKSEEKTFTPEEISSMVILRTYVLGSSSIWTFQIFVVVSHRQTQLKKSKQIFEIQHIQIDELTRTF